MSAADRLRAVRERIESACAATGRSPGDVRLVAVSKTVPVERIRPVVEAGQTVFGENRVQEALGKIDELPDVEWHLIGHLQTNKARHVVGRVALIHGVDSERLARELDARAAAAGVVQPVLVQVRLGGEDTKFGVDEDSVGTLVETVAGCGALELRGLMTIPPPADRPEDNRGWFARLRELRDRESARTGLALAELSMGMTDDFEVAVAEGATLVRVGRAIFGERPPVG